MRLYAWKSPELLTEEVDLGTIDPLQEQLSYQPDKIEGDDRELRNQSDRTVQRAVTVTSEKTRRKKNYLPHQCTIMKELRCSRRMQINI